MFSEYLHRDWLDVEGSTKEEFEAFLNRHNEFFVKAVNTSGGNQIWKCNMAKEKRSLKQLRASMKGCILGGADHPASGYEQSACRYRQYHTCQYRMVGRKTACFRSGTSDWLEGLCR